MKYNKKAGFSLLEVLIFVTILGLFFLTAISISIISIRDMTINQHRIVASRLAEEMMEWFRSKKETDWNAFNLSASGFLASDPDGCAIFNSSSWTPTSADCTGIDPTPIIINNQKYTRKVTVAVTATQVQIQIAVTWQDGKKLYSAPSETIFASWQ